jgi:hypothetical protein
MVDLTDRVQTAIARRRNRGRGRARPAPPPGSASGERDGASGLQSGSRCGPGELGALVACLLALPLDRYELAGQPLEIRVPWLEPTLWLVPGDHQAAPLIEEGIDRGRIWTAAELMRLLAIPDRTAEAVRAVTFAKLAVAGELAGVLGTRPGSPS